jgi:3-hydroxyisobutyrate dehydrogenase-like beta-hydroxyacid dehydrogenase
MYTDWMKRTSPVNIDNILKGRFDPGFTVDLLLKDVDLALQIARQRDAPLTVAATARQLYDQARAAGFGGQDITAAILPLERRHEIEVRSDGRGAGTGGDKAT